MNTIADYQEKVRKFVSREVIHNASRLVGEISQKAEEFPDWQDDIYALSEGTPDYETDDYRDEIFEHWVVSDWLAARLQEKGETVVEDFFGFTIWCRGAAGHAIFLDSVICEIYNEANQ